MKAAVVNINGNKDIEKTIKKEVDIVKKNPDFVISVGGDGTLLLSERLYPSVPKLAIKTSRICRKCDYTPSQIIAVLRMMKEGKYKIKEESKIEAKFKNKKIVALNEIQIHNKNPSVALRFSVEINKKKYKNLIGDGVIVATPFGSTAYYKSAGGRPFKKGIGIVFNNLYSGKRRSFVTNEKSKIIITVERNEGWLIRDNDDKFFDLKKGDKIIVTSAKDKAKFIKF